jgi:adenine-specific DNA-methyltransferase
MNGKQKLELTWIGKDQQPVLEPRILIEDPEKSYGNKNTQNMLIHGDNLLALKALEQDFAGKIKCIYIDPPYNTGNAFEHYDDMMEHSIWLNLIWTRVKILHNLLKKDGFFCCHIDDSEGHYLKSVLDEIFGRSNYLTTFYIRVRYPDKTLKSDMDFHKEIEQIHIYRKEYGAKPNLNEIDLSLDKFKYYIKEKGNGKALILGNKEVTIFTKDEYSIEEEAPSEYGLKEIWASGSILDGNSSGRFFRDHLTGRYNEDGYGVLYKVKGIGNDRFEHRYFTGPKRQGATKGKYYQGVPVDKLEGNSDQKGYLPINNFYDLAANFGNCRLEGNADFRSGKKPEKLLEIIIKHFSNNDDWVLDSFLGSGTTAAVAHKMGRKWIGIELGDHCNTHCLPRLKAVVDGTDQGGISESVNWQGGGGFRYYYLAPSLLNEDRYGNWIISGEYNPQMLAAAMAKHMNFKYSPDEELYWKQGTSTEKDFIFTTTNHITVEHLDRIQEEMKPDESLLICCTSFDDACRKQYSNINVKKIPQMLLGKCEFGKEDYSLNIVNAPVNENEPEFIPVGPVPKAKKTNGKKSKKFDEITLFDMGEMVNE